MTVINSNRAIRGPVTAVPVVAGKGVRLVADTENNRIVVEADETVLWEGSATSATLSESAASFDRIRIYFEAASQSYVQEFPGSLANGVLQISCNGTFPNGFVSFYNYRYTISGTSVAPTAYLKETYGNSTMAVRTTPAPTLKKVVGINRIAGGE